VKASAALVAAVAVGDLTPAEAGELGKLIEAYVKALEATDFAARLDTWSAIDEEDGPKPRKTARCD